MAKKPQTLPVPQGKEEVYAHAIATELRRLNELLECLVSAESRPAQGAPGARPEQKTSHRDEMRFRP